ALCVPTWLETIPSTSKGCFDTVIIWEGVAAVQSDSSPLQLYKFIDDDVFQLELPVSDVIVVSEGYWSCVEIRGRFTNGDTLVYHAETPERACEMISTISSQVDSSLAEIVVRLDPDPLRLLDSLSISTRLDEWTVFAQSLSKKWTVVCDSSMPM
ncbi:hypothetical protein PFISCL1PPCAC_4112, partial [Pristionchus fissidentatus]